MNISFAVYQVYSLINGPGIGIVRKHKKRKMSSGIQVNRKTPGHAYELPL
jgi:hypothetical protein